jgi:hypothetical protein
MASEPPPKGRWWADRHLFPCYGCPVLSLCQPLEVSKQQRQREAPADKSSKSEQETTPGPVRDGPWPGSRMSNSPIDNPGGIDSIRNTDNLGTGQTMPRVRRQTVDSRGAVASRRWWADRSGSIPTVHCTEWKKLTEDSQMQQDGQWEYWHVESNLEMRPSRVHTSYRTIDENRTPICSIVE